MTERLEFKEEPPTTEEIQKDFEATRLPEEIEKDEQGYYKSELVHHIWIGYKVGRETIKNKLTARQEDMIKELKKLQTVITEVHQSCLCTRNTYGFNYHEDHERRGKPNPGHRWLTPVDLIENRIGFRWEYEKPTGVCKSWKTLTFKEFP